MKYAFVQQHAGDYPVTVLCRTLALKRSAYYDWRARGAQVIGRQELELRRRMKTLFAESRNSLGSRTLMNKLRKEGFQSGRYLVRNRMKTLGLSVKTKRGFKVTTDSNHELSIAPNVLNRDFSPSAPNRAWGTDITYLWTSQGWVYLAVVIDLYSRRVVGWSMDERMATSLVIRALMMAINLRQPGSGVIHHSDRGSQYASDAYQTLLKQHAMVCSMSRKGNCWDNAPVERFFSSLKREWVGDQQYQTRSEAMIDVRAYVTVYYNAKRLHSTLGYQTPIDFENKLINVSGNC